MKKAAITKLKGRKRPKSVLEKAWATRRANAAERKKLSQGIHAAMGGAPMEVHPPGNNLSAQGLASLAKGTLTSETAIPRSEVNAPKSKLDMQTDQMLIAAKSNNRDDARPRVRQELFGIVDGARYEALQEGYKDHKRETDEAALCGIVAMYRLWDRTNSKPEHAPFLISSIAAKALVEKLEALGYTASGKRREGWTAINR